MGMRGLLIVVVLVGLGVFYFHQKHGTPAPGQAEATVSVTASPALTPAPRGQASEHNYMKRAIDRAKDVTEQSRARTQADQNP